MGICRCIRQRMAPMGDRQRAAAQIERNRPGGSLLTADPAWLSGCGTLNVLAGANPTTTDRAAQLSSLARGGEGTAPI